MEITAEDTERMKEYLGGIADLRRQSGNYRTSTAMTEYISAKTVVLPIVRSYSFSTAHQDFSIYLSSSMPVLTTSRTVAVWGMDTPHLAQYSPGAKAPGTHEDGRSGFHLET